VCEAGRQKSWWKTWQYLLPPVLPVVAGGTLGRLPAGTSRHLSVKPAVGILDQICDEHVTREGHRLRMTVSSSLDDSCPW
jgi:hypothetical protein